LARVKLRQRQAEELDSEERTLFMQLSGAFQILLAEEKQEGRQEGKQEEGANLVMRQLARRVGQISSDLEAQIRGSDLTQIEDLGEALLDFKNVSDLINWLPSTQSPLRERVSELVYDALAKVKLRQRQAEELDSEERTLYIQLSGAFQIRLAEEKQEGKLEGRQEEGVNLVMRQLARRVGHISPDLEAQIRGLDLTQIENLGEALLDFEHVSDLVNWLP
jgi:hypothetical protein